MRRAFLSLVIFAALSAPTVHAAAANVAHRSSRAEHQVRITPTQLSPGETSIDIGPNGWSLQGYDLRGLLARVFDIPPARIELDTAQLVSAQNGTEPGLRYDVSVALTGNESDADIHSMLRKALEERFHLTTALETRSMDAYVLTAPAGAGHGMRAVADVQLSISRPGSAELSDAQSVITVAGRVCPGISSAGITAQATTVEALAAALEDNLDRVVLDETHLAPAFDFQIPEYHSREELFSLLHDKLGLAVHVERREVRMLSAHAQPASGTALLAGI